MRIGSLFSGYGGLDQAVSAVTGAETAWVSDIDKGACKILAHRYGDVPNLGDITTIDWASVEPVDILTGGFPCQDLSHAGKRAGLKEGTRSGLWSYMAQAIDELRPRMVVAENVRGLLSAQAPSDVEPCAWCVGDGPTVDLRALGVVLADLADIGYDAQWCGLRAADVGACHGRFRVFLIAHPADTEHIGHERPVESRQRTGLSAELARPAQDTDSSTGGERWLATPRQETGGRPRADVGRSDREGTHGVSLLPSPRATDGTKGGPNQRGSSGDLTVEDWDTWTDAMKAEHGNGNGHGKSLAIETLRLLPTPCASENGGERDLEHRQAAGSQMELSDTVRLLPTPDASAEKYRLGGDSQQSRSLPAMAIRGELATATDAKASGGGYNGQNNVTLTDATARNGMLLPTPLVGSTSPASHGQISGQFRDQMDAALARFGDYAPAIARWEAVIGRPAPSPTEPTGKNGAHRLSPRFVEFMMGLSAGWVTDVPDLTRNEALKALGNGVVPQQAIAALRHMLTRAVAA